MISFEECRRTGDRGTKIKRVPSASASEVFTELFTGFAQTFASSTLDGLRLVVVGRVLPSFTEFYRADFCPISALAETGTVLLSIFFLGAWNVVGSYLARFRSWFAA